MKKKTDCGYLYYTHPRSFYPVREGSLKFEELRFPKKESFISNAKNERILMEKWCSGNLRGLSQKTPRQRSEKDNTGTLPIQAYMPSVIPVLLNLFAYLKKTLVKIFHKAIKIYQLNQSYQLSSLKFGLLNMNRNSPCTNHPREA